MSHVVPQVPPSTSHLWPSDFPIPPSLFLAFLLLLLLLPSPSRPILLFIFISHLHASIIHWMFRRARVMSPPSPVSAVRNLIISSIYHEFLYETPLSYFKFSCLTQLLVRTIYLLKIINNFILEEKDFRKI